MISHYAFLLQHTQNSIQLHNCLMIMWEITGFLYLNIKIFKKSEYFVLDHEWNFDHTNTNKRAGWNKRAGGNFFSKSINVQTKIRPCRGDFLLKINKRACTSIRYNRVCEVFSFWWEIVSALVQVPKRDRLKPGSFIILPSYECTSVWRYQEISTIYTSFNYSQDSRPADQWDVIGWKKIRGRP